MMPLAQRLANALNLYFDVGCHNFTRHEVLAYGEWNQRRVEESLQGWEAKGFLQMLKPVTGSDDSEIIVKVIKRIEEPVFYLSPVTGQPPSEVGAVREGRTV